MFQLVFTNRFRKDVRILQKRGYNMGLLKNVIIQIETSGTLPVKTNRVNYQVIITVFGKLI